MHLSVGKASKGFIANGLSDLTTDCVAYPLPLRLKLDSGGSMAGVQVVHLVSASFDIMALLCT